MITRNFFKIIISLIIEIKNRIFLCVRNAFLMKNILSNAIVVPGIVR